MKDVIIVGGGPAGMSAALNILREGKSVLILEKETFGGQIATSPRVENLPGIKEISGSEYASNLFDQVTSLGAEFELENVLNISKKDNFFEVKTNYHEYQTRTIIIATGCEHKKLNIPNEDKFAGNGVSYCAVCDGAFYKNENVIVIGDANTALQYSLMLSDYCKNITLVTLFDKFFADEILIERFKKHENIKVLHNLSAKEFVGTSSLESVIFTNTLTNKEIKIDAKGVFVAIGQKPHNQLFKGLVEIDKNGYIITNENMETSTPGIYAIGDCRSKKYRQVATAISDALIAAIEIGNYLR